MKRNRFTETKIISILKEADAGAKVKDVCRRHGISDATINCNFEFSLDTPLSS